jgi:hypothetical protein
MKTGFHLAQANVARCRAPLDTPITRDFVELLPAINALADASHGFVWRLPTEDGDATAIRAYDDPLVIFNMSVWTGLAKLNQYVFRSSHLYALRRRRDWFEPMNPASVMWDPFGLSAPSAGGKSQPGATGSGRTVARGIQLYSSVPAAGRPRPGREPLA